MCDQVYFSLIIVILTLIVQTIPNNAYIGWMNDIGLSKNVQISASGIYNAETSNNQLEREANQSSIEIYKLIIVRYLALFQSWK